MRYGLPGTPRKTTDPIEFLRNSPFKRSTVVEVNYDDNPWFFETTLSDEMEYDRARDMEKFLHVWKGGFETNSKARIFNNWTVDEFEAPKGTVFRLGADWGYAIDPTVLIRVYVEGKRLYVDYEAHAYRCDIQNIPDLFGTIPDSTLYPIIADSSRPETIAHVRNNGYPRIFKSVKGPGSVKEGIEWLQSFDIIVHPRCLHTISELENYKYKVDNTSGDVTGVPVDAHNHVIDALRYACESARKLKKTEKAAPIKPQKNYWN